MVVLKHTFDYAWYQYCKDKKISTESSVDVDIKDNCTSKIRADICVQKSKSICIWGYVRDCCGLPIPNILVKLIQYSKENFCEVAETTSDCHGIYQFYNIKAHPHMKYKVIAHCPIEDKICCPETLCHGNPFCCATKQFPNMLKNCKVCKPCHCVKTC